MLSNIKNISVDSDNRSDNANFIISLWINKQECKRMCATVLRSKIIVDPIR